jgi:hypothetical protein
MKDETRIRTFQVVAACNIHVPVPDTSKIQTAKPTNSSQNLPQPISSLQEKGSNKKTKNDLHMNEKTLHFCRWFLKRMPRQTFTKVKPKHRFPNISTTQRLNFFKVYQA